jgi:integrase
MKLRPLPQEARLVTLQDVLDRVISNPTLPPTRERDLASAVRCYAKLIDQPPASVPLDLAAIRHTLDTAVPPRAIISAKRWSNLRSDLAAAIDASGLHPMLPTARVIPNEPWRRLLADAPQPLRHALSRLARWATLRGISPAQIDGMVLQRFDAELHSGTLVRNLRYRSRLVRRAWNALAAHSSKHFRRVHIEPDPRVLRRLPWSQFPGPLQAEVDDYCAWAAVPDPLDDAARDRALSPRTLRLQRQHLHSAANAAVAAGLPIERLTSLARLTEPETVRAALRHLRREAGDKATAFVHGVAITLILVAKEWLKAAPQTVAVLRDLRRRIGKLPRGLTEKNKTLLRTLDDPRLLDALLRLPDRLWHSARSQSSPYFLCDLQTALAIDILLHAPMRMQNLSALQFGVHLHWPQGPRKPVQVTLRSHETKNEQEYTPELPAPLGERLLRFRNEIAPTFIGRRPECVFFRRDGRPKGQAAVAIGICKTIKRHLGIKMTPHQFRHLCAKIILDANPAAYELVRQMLGHSSAKTTTNFYAEPDTRRAGRAHADLIRQLRESRPHPRGPRGGFKGPQRR